MQIRELDALDPHDHGQTQRLRAEAFGVQVDETTPPSAQPGRHAWGAFDGDRLVARASWLEHRSWFGGVEVPTAGVAGVAVAAEHRGRGLLRPLFEQVWAEARAAGYAVSTLFPTALGVYRSLGYELIGSYDHVEVPTAELARVRAPAGVRTRRAEVADVPAVRDVYARWAAAQNGPLTRTGPLFEESDEELLAESIGVSVAVDADGAVVGYASWRRNRTYGADGVLHVDDLLALSGDGYRALWALIGSFTSVARLVRLRTSGADPARLLLPTSTWDVVSRYPYALAVLDDGAFAERGVPLPEGIGLTPQGTALLYAGAQDCANLRLLGHLSGPTSHDAVLDAALVGRPLHVRDYF